MEISFYVWLIKFRKSFRTKMIYNQIIYLINKSIKIYLTENFLIF